MELISAKTSDFLETRIPVHAHSSAESLKHEIRRVVHDYANLGWRFVNLHSRGAFIYLTFALKDFI